MNGPDTLRPLGSSPRNRWQVGDASVSLVREEREPRPVTVHDSGRAVTFDLARTAVLVVDMQNDFCHPDGWLGHIGVDVAPARRPIAPLRRVLPALRGAGVPVVWLNWGNRPDRLNLSPALLHVYNPTGAGVGLGDRLPNSGAAVLEAGSWAAAIVDELVPDPADIHVAKYRMSGFPDTPLDSILRNLRVTTLLFAGVNLDQCVLCTLQDANFPRLRLPAARRLRRHDIAGFLYRRDALQHPPVLRLRDGRTGAARTDLTAHEHHPGGRLGRHHERPPRGSRRSQHPRRGRSHRRDRIAIHALRAQPGGGGRRLPRRHRHPGPRQHPHASVPDPAEGPGRRHGAEEVVHLHDGPERGRADRGGRVGRRDPWLRRVDPLRRDLARRLHVRPSASRPDREGGRGLRDDRPARPRLPRLHHGGRRTRHPGSPDRDAGRCAGRRPRADRPAEPAGRARAGRYRALDDLGPRGERAARHPGAGRRDRGADHHPRGRDGVRDRPVAGPLSMHRYGIPERHRPARAGRPGGSLRAMLEPRHQGPEAPRREDFAQPLQQHVSWPRACRRSPPCWRRG